MEARIEVTSPTVSSHMSLWWIRMRRRSLPPSRHPLSRLLSTTTRPSHRHLRRSRTWTHRSSSLSHPLRHLSRRRLHDPRFRLPPSQRLMPGPSVNTPQARQRIHWLLHHSWATAPRWDPPIGGMSHRTVDGSSSRLPDFRRITCATQGQSARRQLRRGPCVDGNTS